MHTTNKIKPAFDREPKAEIFPEIQEIIDNTDIWSLDIRKTPKTEGLVQGILTQEQLEEDVNVLIKGFIGGYGGLPFFSDEDQRHLQTQLLNLKGLQNPTKESLGLEICKIFASIQDEHLNVYINSPRGNPLRNPIIASVGNNLAKEKNEYDISRQVIGGKNASIIAIPHLLDRKNVWENFNRDTDAELNETSDLCIIDIRGNGGGNSIYTKHLVEKLYGNASDICKAEHARRTAEAIFMEHLIYNKNMLNEEWLQIKDGFALDNEKVYSKHYPQSNFNPNTGYNKPIYILQDRKTLSSGESLIISLRKHPNLKTIGENTGGCNHFGNVNYFRLPNTKILAKIGVCYREYEMGFIESSGIEPDIKLAPSIDAFGFLQEKIRRERINGNVNNEIASPTLE